MKTIAVIDDDIYIGDMLETVLKKEGYAVLRAYSGTEAVLLLDTKTPDLILLDLMLPGLSGEEILPRLSGTPVIIVSARIDLRNKVELLLAGAADYVTKPFEVKELLARITVQLRNHENALAARMYQFGELTLNSIIREVRVKDVPEHLTKTEFIILKLLLQNQSQVVTKSVMLERISEESEDCMESSLKVHVSNLRKKLREVNGHDYIETVWGIGFKMQ